VPRRIAFGPRQRGRTWRAAAATLGSGVWGVAHSRRSEIGRVGYERRLTGVGTGTPTVRGQSRGWRDAPGCCFTTVWNYGEVLGASAAPRGRFPRGGDGQLYC